MAKKKPSNPTTPPLLGSIFKPDPQEDFKGPESTVVDIQPTAVPQKFKRSQHLVNQILKDSSKPVEVESLEGTTQNKIGEHIGREITIQEGIPLDANEYKVVLCLSQLLHEKSLNTRDEGRDDYYIGNGEYTTVEFGGVIRKAPSLYFSLYEITTTYWGKTKKVSGKEMENIRGILDRLNEKRFLVRMKETRKIEGGKSEVLTIENYISLVKIAKREEFDNKTGLPVEVGSNNISVKLHPIFNLNLDTYFILLPGDILDRTRRAYGSSNPSKEALMLIELLVREIKQGRYTYSKNLEEFYKLLDYASINQGRKGRVKQKVNKAIETVEKLGIVVSTEIRVGAKGQEVIAFSLNSNWD